MKLPTLALALLVTSCATQAKEIEPIQDAPVTPTESVGSISPQTQTIAPSNEPNPWEGRPDINAADWPTSDIDPINPDLVKPGDADPIPALW